MLVVLLSNLFDNAIEACKLLLNEKIIRISIIHEETVFISIENTSLPVKIVNGTIMSTKANKQEHGYGLQNVKVILNELSAEYALKYQDGWFAFVAEIPKQ